MSVQHFFYAVSDFIQVAVTVDNGVPFGTGGGSVEINAAHTHKEIRLLLLETVFLARLPDTRHRHFERHIQQQGQRPTLFLCCF